MVLFEEFERQGGYVLLELNLLAVGEHGSSEDKVCAFCVALFCLFVFFISECKRIFSINLCVT